MSDLEVFFQSMTDEPRNPYIRDQDTKIFHMDASGGSITFNGYYYVEDHPPPYPEGNSYNRFSKWLPQQVLLHVKRNEERHIYIVEIYKRITHESTNEMSTIEEDDGTAMDVCFFPTNKQTLFFHVIEKLK